MKRIIQLVPGLAPMLNGVGDFSLVLARALRDRFGIVTHFVVCSARWRGPGELEGFEATPVHGRDPRNLASHLDEACSRTGATFALLQLSPYGFDPSGAPFWLAEALCAWKRSSPGRSAATYFHELFATSAPWRKGFWLSPIQRRASARIARISERLMTNRVAAAEWLGRAAAIPVPSIEVLPVLSGVDEPKHLPSHRDARLVVWGSGATKTVLYRQYRDLLGGLAGKLRLESVIDIGSAAADTPCALGPAEVTSLGIAPAERIRELLESSAVGVMGYPPALLGKSSIFAAFAANALPALVLDRGNAPRALPDGLVRETHLFTREDAAGASPGALARVGGAARDWYAGHDARRHAEHVALIMASLASRKPR